MPKTVKTEKNLFNEERLYKISNVLSGKFLTANENGELFIAAAKKDDGQKWKIVKENDCYILISALSGKVADIILAGTVNGARIHMWEKTGKSNQLWSAEKVKAGTYKLKSAASGKCMDVVDISDEDGTPVQIWDDLNGENQMWKISAVPVSKKAPAKTGRKNSAVKKTEAPKTQSDKADKANSKAAAKPSVSKEAPAKPVAAAAKSKRK